MTPQETKQALLAACKTYVQDRKQKILNSIKNIEESLFEEGKSTAGDKHHTGRAMLQIDRENAGKQLLEIEKLEQIAHRIQIENSSEAVKMGSLVFTQNAAYFMSVSMGAVTVDQKTVICVSLASPIGALLRGKLVGESFTFNNTHYQITEIH